MKEIIYVLFFYFLFCYVDFSNGEFRQEMAKLDTCNPKFFTNCSIFTARKNRHDKYMTNMTGTPTLEIGNNVTVIISLEPKTGTDWKISVKVCDMLRLNWAKDFITFYSNIDYRICPIPPFKPVSFFNMELPPKNLPLPPLHTDFTMRFAMQTTETHENMLLVHGNMYYVRSNKKT